MVAPPVAAAQHRSPTPSAEELWNTYPLQQTPEPDVTPDASARPAGARPTAARQSSETGTPLPLIGAAGLLIALAGGLAVVRVRSRQPAPHGRWAAPLLPAAAAVAMVPSQRARSPRITALADGPPPSSGDRPHEGVRPPDPRRAWTAEVEWSASRFAVVAREHEGDPGVRLATSGPLPWPPSDANALQEITRAAEHLESSLLTAGWTPLAPGSAWYAKRFAWAGAPRLAEAEAGPEPEPEAEAELEPEEAPAPAAEPAALLPQPAAAPQRTDSPQRTDPPRRIDPPRATGRFTRQVEWPEGSETLWRCEIKWHAGYVNSYFEAAAHGPGRRRGVTLAQSDLHKWLLKDDPVKGNALYTAQVRRLAGRLVAAGWSPAGRGRHWYELRFVWRHAEPPDRLEPVEPAAKAER